MTNMLGFSDSDGKAVISDTLRLFVGHGRRMSWSDLAAATGDDERKLRSYVEQDPAAMPAPVMMRVFAVLPPEAFGRVCRFMGYSQPAALDADDGSSVRRAMAKAARLVAEGNEALEDGMIDHRERAQLQASAEELLPILTAFVINKD